MRGTFVQLTKAARVRQQVTQRDRSGGLQLREFRQVLLDRIVERQLAVIDQQRDGDCGDGLAHGRNPEDVVGLHLPARADVRMADGAKVKHRVFRGQKRDDAGNFARVDECLHRRRDSIERCAGLRGRRWRRAGDRQQKDEQTNGHAANYKLSGSSRPVLSPN